MQLIPSGTGFFESEVVVVPPGSVLSVSVSFDETPGEDAFVAVHARSALDADFSQITALSQYQQSIEIPASDETMYYRFARREGSTSLSVAGQLAAREYTGDIPVGREMLPARLVVFGLEEGSFFRLYAIEPGETEEALVLTLQLDAAVARIDMPGVYRWRSDAPARPYVT